MDCSDAFKEARVAAHQADVVFQGGPEPVWKGVSEYSSAQLRRMNLQRGACSCAAP